MCGRYTLIADLSFLMDRFEVPEDSLDYKPSYNIAPTDRVPVVFHDGRYRRAEMMRWGLVPYWSKEPRTRAPHINARAEGLQDSRMFGNAWQGRRRCLVPADSFYEWRTSADRGPFRITLASGEPFAFAGLWERWRPKAGQAGGPFSSMTIVTTGPNDLIVPIHDRMPVVLPREAEAMWLDPSVEPEAALTLLKPYPAEAMRMYAVSSLVNNVRNNGPELIESVTRLGD